MRIEYALLLIIPALIVAGCTSTPASEEPLLCTQEARECADGSYVGRNPQNNCEFDPCPVLTPPVPPTPPLLTVQTKEFTLEADDSGFYPTSTIDVNKGDDVKITFTVRTGNTYFAGLEVRSDAFNTGQIAKGGTKTVEFIADESFQFTSYWPSTNTMKATGQVNVS